MNYFEQEIKDRVKFEGGFVNAHSHLDRTWSINFENLAKSQKNLKDKWSMVREYKQNVSESGLASRMFKEIKWQILQGATQIVTFLDFDKYSKTKPFNAYTKVKEKILEEYDSDVELICVNQTIEGVIDSESFDYFQQGAELSDLVGGLPGRDAGREEEHLDIIFREAKKQNKKLHIHVDQFSTPDETETELVLKNIRYYEYKDKVSLIHCLSLNCHDKGYRNGIYKQIIDTDTSVICCPRAWMDRERNDELLVPVHNPITPIKEMLDCGMDISKIHIGSDNIADIILPFSDADMFKELECLAILNRLYDLDKLVRIASNRVTI